MPDMLDKALQGLRIIDFSYIVSGPFCTKCLGDYGAEVVWVENPFVMEIRTHTPFAGGKPGLNRSGLYLVMGSGKLDMVLNLKHPKGLEVARELVRKADVIVEQFTPGTMESLGLGYEDLKKIKPDIILLQLSAQGQTGPYASQPGFGNIMQSMLGFTHLTGWPDRAPSSFPVAPYVDFLTGFAAITLLVSAVVYRQRTGKGQCIDLSMAEASLQCLAPTLLDYTANGRQQERTGNLLDRAAPHAAFRCQGHDQWCAIGVFNDEQWHRFCILIGKSELIEEPRFATLLARKQNEEELNRIIESWTVDYSSRQLMVMIQQAGIPAAHWYDERDINECPALRERGFFQTQTHSEIGEWSWPAPPFKLSRTPYAPSPVPIAGQDTYLICTKLLGMSDLEFAKLEEEGLFRIAGYRDDKG